MQSGTSLCRQPLPGPDSRLKVESPEAAENALRSRAHASRVLSLRCRARTAAYRSIRRRRSGEPEHQRPSPHHVGLHARFAALLLVLVVVQQISRGDRHGEGSAFGARAHRCDGVGLSGTPPSEPCSGETAHAKHVPSIAEHFLQLRVTRLLAGNLGLAAAVCKATCLTAWACPTRPDYFLGTASSKISLTRRSELQDTLNQQSAQPRNRRWWCRPAARARITILQRRAARRAARGREQRGAADERHVRWHERRRIYGWRFRLTALSEASMEAVPWCALCAIALRAYAGAPMHVCRRMAAVVYPT